MTASTMVFFFFGLGLASDLAAQSPDKPLARCKSSNTELSLAACTEIIQNGVPGDDLATALTFRGIAYLRKNQYDPAIKDLDEAIRMEPDADIAFANRGSAYAGKRQFERAIEDFDEAIRLRPRGYPGIFNQRGIIYTNQGLFDLAIRDFDQAILLQPRFPDAYNSRGTAYQGKHLLERAIEDFDEAIRQNPDFAWAYHNRGNAYSDKGQDDLAIEDYSRAIQRASFPAVFDRRGDAYSNSGQYDRAIADYDQAIRLASNYSIAYHGRGRVEFYIGRWDDAAMDFQKSFSMGALDPYSMLWLHLTRLRAGQDDLQRFSTQAARMDATKWPAPVADLFLGRMTSEQLLGAAANPNPRREAGQRCEAEFYVGEFLLSKQDTNGATEHFRRAVEICPYEFVERGGAVRELQRIK